MDHVSNPDETLALLEPHGARFDGSGRGVIPELSKEDVLLALGLIPEDRKPHATVYLALHWPTPQSLQEADELIKNSQLRECVRRAKKIVIAKLAVDIAKGEADGSHGVLHGVRRALAEARANLETARADKWPRYDTRYEKVRAAVLFELHDPKRCRTCAGRGNVLINAVVRPCAECSGTGKRAYSDQARAEAIGLSRQTYKHAWEGLYLWTLELCSRAEAAARDAFAKAMGRE